MEDFATRVDDAELGRIALVAFRNDGGRIAERVRAIRLRLLVGVQVEAVHERLGAVVQAARAGAVRVRVRINRGQRVVATVENRLGLVADVLVDLDVLAERSTRARRGRRGRRLAPGIGDARTRGGARTGNNGALPVGVVGRVGDGCAVRLDVRGAGSFDRQRAEQAVVDQGAVGRAGVHVVRTLERRIVRDEVGVASLATRVDTARVVLTDRVARGGHLEVQAVDVQPNVAAGHRVGEVDDDAVTAVGADRQWLDGIFHDLDGAVGLLLREPVQAERDAVRLGGRVVELGLLVADRASRGGVADLAVQREHVRAGIVVAKAVQRHRDVDRRDVERLDGRAGGAGAAVDHAGRRGGRHRDALQARGGADHHHDRERRAGGERADLHEAADQPAAGGHKRQKARCDHHISGERQQTVADQVGPDRQVVATVLAAEQGRVQRIADGDDDRRIQRNDRRDQRAGRQSRGISAIAGQQAACQMGRQEDAKRNHGQRECRVAQPVNDGVRSVLLGSTLCFMQEVQPQSTAVGEGEAVRGHRPPPKQRRWPVVG